MRQQGSAQGNAMKQQVVHKETQGGSTMKQRNKVVKR
jgi:hypothetical protein